MMRRISGFLLVLIFSISIVGCGNASASSENANSNNDSTPSVENLPALSQGVSNTTVSDGSVSSETTIETTEVVSEPEPEPEPEQNFTGSLYTLPVGAKGEEWTEAQLDEYLKDCKAYQDNLQIDEDTYELDFDAFVADLGFEYVSSYIDERYRDYALYEKSVGSMKVVIQLTSMSDVNICADDGKNSVIVFLSGNASHSVIDDRAFFSTHYLEHSLLRGERVVFLKGACASLIQVAEGEMDFARLPFALEYDFAYAQNGSVGIQDAVEYATVGGKSGFVEEDVYPD